MFCTSDLKQDTANSTLRDSWLNFHCQRFIIKKKTKTKTKMQKLEKKQIPAVTYENLFTINFKTTGEFNSEFQNTN